MYFKIMTWYILSENGIKEQVKFKYNLSSRCHNLIHLHV